MSVPTLPAAITFFYRCLPPTGKPPAPKEENAKGYVARKGNCYYAVIYEGTDPVARKRRALSRSGIRTQGRWRFGLAPIYTAVHNDDVTIRPLRESRFTSTVGRRSDTRHAADSVAQGRRS